jgi:Tol biopolymer transport system component
VKPIRGGLLSGVGAVVALLALSPAISWATFPGDNGRIAYSCNQSYLERRGICTILPDGTGIEQLATPGYSPSWSADGESLVFVRSRRVFTMDADGSNQTQVTFRSRTVWMQNPGFSPDGGWIVFERIFDRQWGGTPAKVSLWTVRTDGTDGHRIVGHNAATPVYSPSGRRIAFHGRPRDAARDGIWKIRPDGARLRRLTDPQGVGDYVLDWSPDGEHILFLRGGDPWTMRADGSVERPFSTYGQVYSPRGNRLAFGSGVYDNVSDSWMCFDIHTIRLNGSDRRSLTDNCRGFDGYASDPSWQPTHEMSTTLSAG